MGYGILKEMQAKELKTLEKDLSAKDRKEICTKLNKTKSCISRYLKGEVSSTDIAYDIIEMGKKLLSRRYEQLNKKEESAA